MSTKFENEKSSSISVRVTTREIDDAIEQLQTAFGDGRLDEHEFDERMALALKSKTKGELASLLTDIPTVIQTHVPKKSGLRLRDTSLVIFSGLEQKGRFVLPKYHSITAIMGGCLLDLSEAVFESNVSEMHISAIMGGVQIFVPKNIRVEIHKMPFLGGISSSVHGNTNDPNAPLLRIHARAIMGGIEIKTKKT